MVSTRDLSPEECATLIVRLRKIEGQSRGIQKMLAEGRSCHDVITQIVAIRAATDALCEKFTRDVALCCLQHPQDFDSPEDAVSQAAHLLVFGARGRSPGA